MAKVKCDHCGKLFEPNELWIDENGKVLCGDCVKQHGGSSVSYERVYSRN